MSSSPPTAAAAGPTIRVNFRDRKPGKVIREDSVIVRVFPVREVRADGSVRTRHEARWKFAGEQKRKVFSDEPRGGKSSKTLAEEFARREAEKIANGKTVGAGFSQADEACHIRITARGALNDQRTGREEYLEVKLDRLCAFDEYRHALGLSEDQARAILTRAAPSSIEAVPTQRVVDELLLSIKTRTEAKRIQYGATPSTENYRKLNTRLNKFSERFPAPLAQLDRKVFHAWLNEICKTPKTWNHYRAAVLQAARFARREKYISQDKLEELLHVQPFEISDSPADPHTPKELQTIIEYAELKAPDFVCAIVAVCLVGFRVAEVASEKGFSDYEDFDLDAGEALVRAGHSKVGKNRRMPMSANAIAFFRKYGKPSGPLCGVKSFTIKFKRLCERAGVKARDNGLRASFISHDVALRGDKGSTAQRAGTSVAKIESNYLRWPSQTDALAWSRIAPTEAQLRLRLVTRGDAKLGRTRQIGGSSGKSNKSGKGDSEPCLQGL